MQKSRTRYSTTYGYRTQIGNYKMDQGVASNMSGFVINNNTAYCVKRDNSVDKSAIWTISNITSTSPSVSSKPKVVNCAALGMTYYNHDLYLSCRGGKVAKVSADDASTDLELFSVKADGKTTSLVSISHYQGNKFVLMAASLNVGDEYYCFVIGTFSSTTNAFVETDRFYIKNTGGYEQPQDIHYDPSYGLFIATNQKTSSGYTTQNRILRAEIDGSPDGTYNGFPLFIPTSEYSFHADKEKFSECNIKSLCLSHTRILYVATNLVATDKNTEITTDGIFYINNMKFKRSTPFEFTFSANTSVQIPNPSFSHNGKTYKCVNPGAFAMNGKVGYCLITHTASEELKDRASILLKSNDVASEDFVRVGTDYLKTMGHGNGMTYYNGALYVASYIRKNNQKTISKISTQGKLLKTYTCDTCIGGISLYQENKTDKSKTQFILVDYDGKNGESYAKNPTFYIGYFDDSAKKFVKQREFSAVNPTFEPTVDIHNKKKNYLQDIYYDPVHGLFFITLTEGVDRIYHITPEQIEHAVPGEPIMPKEALIPASTIKEMESLSISPLGYLFIAINSSDPSDQLKRFSGMKFYKDTL